MRKYFGTDGIRSVANTKLTPLIAFKVAKAGAYILSKEKNDVPVIVIGKDTRISGDLLESAMTAGFLSCGAKVLQVGVLPTPAIAYLTKKIGATAGVVISASHNSYEFNGIKFFSNKGMKISDEIEEEIEKVMDDDEKLNAITADNEKIGMVENASYLKEEYIDFIVYLFENDFKGKVEDDFKVVIDTANGATYEVAEKVFEKLGINYTVINNKPNGININDKCGSTHLEMLTKTVLDGKYNLGIAYDGDGDRCLLIDEKGKLVDGDKILAIISMYLKSNGKLNKDTIVATVMSNLGLRKYCKENNLNFEMTSVGDRYVLESMLKNGYNLGGEQSGHIIFLDYNPTGDGILTSLMILNTLFHFKKDISELANIVTIYPQVLVNAKVNSDRKKEYINDAEIQSKIKEIENEFSEDGRVLIRPSGTEHLVRVMIEGKDLAKMEQKANELASLIESRLK